MGPESIVDAVGLLTAVEQAGDSIVVTDPSGIIRYVNPAFTQMTGFTGEDVVGKDPSVLKSGRQPKGYYEQLWKTIGSGQIWNGELVNRRKDGTFYDEEMRITPVLGAEGQIISYIAIKRDVTKRRAAEHAQGLLAAVVEGSDDAIIAFSPTGILLTWNRAAEAMFGYSAAEAVGKPLAIIRTEQKDGEWAVRAARHRGTGCGRNAR